MAKKKGLYGPLTIAHDRPVTMDYLSKLVDGKKWEAILLPKKTYKQYDSILNHFGKKCGNPCKDLTFQGIKLVAY